MEGTAHVLLVAAGAEEFRAGTRGWSSSATIIFRPPRRVPPIPARWARWRSTRREGSRRGRARVASTSGARAGWGTRRSSARGTYADNAVGAISGTGQGEFFPACGPGARHRGARVEHGGLTLDAAVRAAVEGKLTARGRPGRGHRVGPGGPAHGGFQHADDGARGDRRGGRRTGRWR